MSFFLYFAVHPKPINQMLKPPPSRVNSNSLVTFPFPDLPVIPRPKKRRKCRRKITKCTFKKAFRMFWRWMKKLERRKKRQRRRRRKNKKNRKRNQNYNPKDYRDQSHQTFLQTFRKPLPINWFFYVMKKHSNNYNNSNQIICIYIGNFAIQKQHNMKTKQILNV